MINEKLISKKNLKNIFFCLGISIYCNVFAQQYPFTLPTTVTATYNVETGVKENFRNKLLGYNISGFKTPTEQSFIKRFDPISIRYPSGVFSNFYQWQDDSYQKDSYDNMELEEVLDIYAAVLKGDVDYLAQLNTERKNTLGSGYNMMWTYAVNFDDAKSCVDRATQDRAKGFQVQDIELGNELYYSNQRSNQTNTPQKIGDRSQLIANALKAKFPDIKVSIPVEPGDYFKSYGLAVIKDKNYFDAFSLHSYMGKNPAVNANEGNAELLTMSLDLKERVKYLHDNFAPNKPIWLSEWGVTGEVPEVYSAACLGMADVFMFMAENQNIYETANWYGFNDPLNAMVVVDPNFTGPIYPLKRRGYLSVYEIVYDVFKDADLLKGTMTTTKMNTPRGTLDAVRSRVTMKNGKATAMVVNLTNKPVTYTLKIDGSNYSGNFKHEALVFNGLGTVAPLPIDDNPVKLIKQGNGVITLPALSISKISDLVLPGTIQGPAGYTYAANEWGTVNVTNVPKDIAYGNNGTFVYLTNQRQNVSCQNSTFGSDPVPNVVKYCFEKESKAPFGLTPVSIPGTIEMENFDFGGQGVSYNDTDTENRGNLARQESGVDIVPGSSGFAIGFNETGEWQNYSVNVTSSGEYDFKFFSAAEGTTGRIKISMGNTVVANSIAVPNTGNWGLYQPFTQKINLTKGLNIMKLEIANTGFNLDKIEITPSTPLSLENSGGDLNLAVYPNPSENGVFNFSNMQSYKVYDLIGNLISGGIGTSVDLSSSPKGIYILHFDSRKVELVRL